MAHRFGPKKGSARKERPESAEAPDKDLLGKDLLGEGLLGKELLGEGLLSKDSGPIGRDKAPQLKEGRRLRKGLTARETSGGGIPWFTIAAIIILVGLTAGLVIGYLKNQIAGYTATVYVEEPTRLDWVFTASKEGRSTDAPALWSFFDTPRLSQYERYVPPTYDAASGKRYPLILFLSPTDKPIGWGPWSTICTTQEIIFAGVRESGRAKPLWQQVRIALDVLDAVRRDYRIDTDRCYIAGQGEGGKLACKVAFSLPELFGGVIAIDQADFVREIRDETWLRHRVVERLSVALVAGELSDDRSQIDKVFQPYFRDLGIRSETWIEPGVSDAMPPATTLEAVYEWLEKDLPRRQELAKRYPASRIDDAPSRAEWSQRVLEEAERRLADKKNIYPGVVQLRGVVRRWTGTEAAKKAGNLYTNQLSNEDWKDDDRADLIRHDLAVARGLTAYLTQAMPPGLFDRNWERNVMEWGPRAKQAWTDLTARDPMYAEESKKAIAEVDAALKRPATPPADAK